MSTSAVWQLIDSFCLPLSWLLIDAAIKATVLLALASVATLPLWRASAAVRHRIWCLGFCGALLLPLLALAVPQWRIPLIPATLAAGSAGHGAQAGEVAKPIVAPEERARDRESSFAPMGLPTAELLPSPVFTHGVESFGGARFQSEQAGAQISSNELASAASTQPDEKGPAVSPTPMIGALAPSLVGVWLAGLAAVMVPLALALSANWLLLRHARRVTDPNSTGLFHELAARLSLNRSVSLVETGEPVVPMTCGVARPIVVVPGAWAGWPQERRRFVLLHELAHVKRLDVLFQTIARLACALHWFNPLAWYALRRLRVEREHACDDCVIATGERATDYASQLLAIARAYRPLRLAAGVAMARSSKLEHRILAILDRARSHLPLSPHAARYLVGAAAVLVLGLSAVSLGERTADSAPVGDGISGAADSADTPENERRDQQTLSPDGKPAQDAAIPVHGQVLGPDGNPLQGARLFFAPCEGAKPEDLAVRAVTGPDGTFRFSIPQSDLNRLAKGLRAPWSHPYVVAQCDGCGPDWHRVVKPEDARDFTLRLVKDDLPIRGRLVNLEGGPVAEATISVLGIEASLDENLGRWIQALSDYGEIWNDNTFLLRKTLHQNVSGLPGKLESDKEGFFHLSGVGRERVVSLRVEGRTIETTEFRAMTRQAETLRVPYNKRQADHGTLICYGATFTHVAAPSRAVLGTVREAETGEPIPGVTIYCYKRAGNPVHGRHLPEAVTDEEGRYRLFGLPKGQDNKIQIVPPPGKPFLPQAQLLDTSEGLEPLTGEVQLKRGVLIRGRVLDGSTGEPVRDARVEYFALKNPHATTFPGFRESEEITTTTDHDGRYQIFGLPGRGLIAVRAESDEFTADHLIDARDDDYEVTPNLGERLFFTEPYLCPSRQHHAVAVVMAPEDATEVTRHVLLPHGRSLKGQVLGPDGEPLIGVHVNRRGLYACQWFGGDVVLETSEFTVQGLVMGETRSLIIRHPERGLVAAKVVQSDEPEPVAIRLEPAGRIVGRIVDDRGEPVRFITIRGRLSPNQGDLAGHFLSTATDEQGRFRFEGLIPNASYRVGELRRVEQRLALGQDESPEPVDLSVRVGETMDLGDIQLDVPNGAAALRTQPESEQRPAVAHEAEGDVEIPRAPESDVATNQLARPQRAPAKPTRVAAKGRDNRLITVRGRVVGPHGKPAVAAHVAAIAMSTQTARGGDLAYRGELLAQGTTGEDGQYELMLANVSSKTHQYGNLIARKDGLALAWRRLDLDATGLEVPLELAAEETIRGKLIDIEGQPAQGVRLLIKSVMATAADDRPTDGVGFRSELIPAAWIPPAISDEQGRFAILGIPPRHGVFLEVEANDQFAPQEIALNTGMSEQRGERDATYRSLVKNAGLGEEIVLALSPAQVFEGIVTYDDTGQPAPHARLAIGASQQQEYGSMVWVAGRAGAEGRYRIHPKSGIRFGLIAYPPDGVPYLARQTPLSQAIRWEAGDRVKQVDISLPRGVLVRGRVLDAVTQTPIAGASVQYIPETANNPRVSDEILTGWQGIQLSGEDGGFEIAVLPGPGRLLVHGPSADYILQQIGGRELSRGAAGGERNYVHAIKKIEPASNAESIEVNLELRRGATIAGRVVDEQERPVEEVLVITRLKVHPLSLSWRGHITPTLGGRFEIAGVEEGQEYSIHFLNPKRRLGATATLKTGGEEPSVVLAPCGQANLRLVDSGEQPAADYYATVEMVVTPGPSRFDADAMQNGALAADSDFIGNIDQTNYPTLLKSNQDGKLRLLALIPGATYRIVVPRDGQYRIAREFQVRANETVGLGDITVDP